MSDAPAAASPPGDGWPWPEDRPGFDLNAARLIVDPVLGWRRRPGISYERLESLHRKLVIGDHGFRVLPNQPARFDRRVWIFGCSCTEGQWLEDEETFCFLLQERFRSWRIEPWAIGGYSTFQNLLQLEANLVTSTPDTVVFTFIPGHPVRNVADPCLWTPFVDAEGERWTHGLGRGLRTFRPAARLNRQGELFLKKAYPPKSRDEYDGMMENRPDYFYQDIVTTKILRRARDLAEGVGADFSLAVLWSPESVGNDGPHGPDHLEHHPLMTRLRGAGIRIIDADPGLPFDETTFRPIDGHPNALANLHFARKLGDALESGA